MATTTKTYGEHLKDSQNRIKEMVKKGAELTVTISRVIRKWVLFLVFHFLL